MEIHENRWSRSPILENGKPKLVFITAKDRQLFELLNPAEHYRFLNVPLIHGLIGGNYDHIRHRARLLKRKPNSYLYHPDVEFQKILIGNYRHQFYALDDKGAIAIGAEFRPELAENPVQFVHQVMIDSTWASIHIGANGAGVPFVTKRRIMDHKQFPLETRKLKKPFSIHVRVSYKFKEGSAPEVKEFPYTHDGLRALAHEDGTIYYQLEAEHMNMIERGNLEQTSFLKKFLAIRYIMQHHLYEKQWGLKNLMTLVVVDSQQKIDSMKSLILRETEGKGVPYIAFHQIPVLDRVEDKVEPLPLYTDPWQRAGYPDYYLNQ